MLLHSLDEYLRDLLHIPDFDAIDNSVNGIQVTRTNPEITRVAMAVDGCMEIFRRAAEWNADMVMVHHGIYWGLERGLNGLHYRRAQFLIENDISLYAAHLPLDQHAEFGNNILIAKAIGLTDIRPFGNIHGVDVGWGGKFAEPVTLDAVTELVMQGRGTPLSVVPAGNSKISTAAIISGGAPKQILQAIDQQYDLYITGDASHTIYHWALEGNINLISGGHYLTETWGVEAIGRHLAEKFGLKTTFIDLPTGL